MLIMTTINVEVVIVTIIRKQVNVTTSLAGIRRRGISVRRYETADNFVNVAPWTGIDFINCGNDPVMYFKEQNEFPSIAIHGDHTHVLFRDKKTWELRTVEENEARDALNTFIGFLRGKDIALEDC